MKKIFLILTMLAFTLTASAEEKRPNYKKLSPQARKELVTKKRSEWTKMSTAEKLEQIEKQRSERMQQIAAKMKSDNEKWAHLSKEEKIAKYERTMKAFESRINKMDLKKKKPGC